MSFAGQLVIDCMSPDINVIYRYYMVLRADASAEVATCLKSLCGKKEGREWGGKLTEPLPGIEGDRRAW